MAYLDRNTARRPNVGAATAVIAIEALLAVAILRGLAVTFIEREAPPRTIVDNIPLPSPSPTPSAMPTPHMRDPDPMPQQMPSAAPPLGSPTGPLVLTPQPSPVPSPLPSFRPPQPSPSPVAQGNPAMPRGNPGNWVSDSDYPARDLREGNQGRVGFALSIGTDGRVTSCRVTFSSGHAGLDNATCALVSRRARFTPAKGGDGQPAAGSYSGNIRWVIPD